MIEELDIAIIGGGPAGLRAAEVAATAGRRVAVFDGKPWVGRKFLVAGKGGLNLTHGEKFETFVSRYCDSRVWEGILRDFTPEDLVQWCHGLGQETFQASSGRVYPKALKGAPVLRAWLLRLMKLGVEIRPRHLWTDFSAPNRLRFSNGIEIAAKATVFALGGGSWPKTGSDGGWISKFRELGIACAPFVGSNCGWECDWSPEVLSSAEGMPIKNIVAKAGGKRIAGELLLTRYGLEGGAIYALGRELRAMEEPFLEVDLKPTFSESELIAKLSGVSGDSMASAIRRWKLSPPAAALLFLEPVGSASGLAARAKSCRVKLKGPRPIGEAISSAGGVLWSEVDETLMLKKFPGVFLCGEMLDWDAPTGGYLLQGSFATGNKAGKAAAAHSQEIWPGSGGAALG